MLISATKSRKKQQTELVQSVIHAEEEKRRRERKSFNITSVPILARAAYEPSLYHGASEEPDESKSAHNSRQQGEGLYFAQNCMKLTFSWKVLVPKSVQTMSEIWKHSNQ